MSVANPIPVEIPLLEPGFSLLLALVEDRALIVDSKWALFVSEYFAGLGRFIIESILSSSLLFSCSYSNRWKTYWVERTGLRSLVGPLRLEAFK